MGDGGPLYSHDTNDVYDNNITVTTAMPLSAETRADAILNEAGGVRLNERGNK